MATSLARLIALSNESNLSKLLIHLQKLYFEHEGCYLF